MSKTTYVVKSNLDYDNKRYEPGSTVELDDEVAKPLLGGAIEHPGVAEQEAIDLVLAARALAAAEKAAAEKAAAEAAEKAAAEKAAAEAAEKAAAEKAAAEKAGRKK